jgi:7-dehydrocholesterol reductase
MCCICSALLLTSVLVLVSPPPLPNHPQATYIADGAPKTSLLLASGWWGLARHFHYLPEVAASVAWTVPGACQGHLIPYFYAIYLTVLLTDRAFRDDVR